MCLITDGAVLYEPLETMLCYSSFVSRPRTDPQLFKLDQLPYLSLSGSISDNVSSKSSILLGCLYHNRFRRRLACIISRLIQECRRFDFLGIKCSMQKQVAGLNVVHML